jgi:hypothetical protein
LFLQAAIRACSLAWLIADNSSAAKIPIMAITTNSSISVKPDLLNPWSFRLSRALVVGSRIWSLSI